MDKHPPEPLVAHELSPAPNFFGRDRELEELHRVGRRLLRRLGRQRGIVEHGKRNDH